MTSKAQDGLRVVVKFSEGIDLPYDGDVTKHLDNLNVGPWLKLSERFPGISMRRMFTSVKPARIKELVDEATRSDATYRPPNFLTYFVVDLPDEMCVVDLVEEFLAWKSVETAYFEQPADDPTVSPNDDPLSPSQSYLDAAPNGIDARFAWGVPGGDGMGQQVIDLEQGWTLNHEDLVAHDARVLYGTIRDTSRAHGTSVLGEICAVDNDRGCVGIAPNVASVHVVSHSGELNNVANAILAAIDNLPFGGVLLLEVQRVYLPTETLQADFDMIRLATAIGITVVEAAGNGGTNLDEFTDANGSRILNRGNAAFRDSGAIMVGAASSTVPHTRLGFSNFGSRIDCYAWGQNVVAPSSNSAGSTTSYTGGFSGTSSASPIIAGAALLAQGIADASLGRRFGAFQMRALLSNPLTGTASENPGVDHIGVMPDLRAIIYSNAIGLAPAGDVIVSPQVVTVPSGQSVNVAVSWSTTRATSAELRVTAPGQAERVLSTGLSGSLSYGPVHGGETHTFRLFGNGQLLDTDAVVAAAAVTGTISASPQTVVVSGSTGTTTIAWSSQNAGSTAKVYVRVNGGGPSLFAAGDSGTQAAPWIVAGSSYRFSLHAGDSNATELAAVVVTGQAAVVIVPKTGPWWNPARSGNALDLRPLGDSLGVIWLTYNPDGTPVWYLSWLGRTGGGYTGTVDRYTWNGSSATMSVVGTATITLTTPTTGSLAYTIDGRSAVESIEYFGFGGAPTVPSLSGVWSRPTESGWGIGFDTQGNLHSTYVLVYADGQPTWTFGVAAGGATVVSFDLIRTIGTNLCPGCPGPTSVSTATVGTMTVDTSQLGASQLLIDLNWSVWPRSGVVLHRLL